MTRAERIEQAAQLVATASQGVRLPFDTGRDTPDEELWGALMNLRAALAAEAVAPPAPTHARRTNEYNWDALVESTMLAPSEPAPCPECGGRGFVVERCADGDEVDSSCHDCGGSGRVPGKEER